MTTDDPYPTEADEAEFQRWYADTQRLLSQLPAGDHRPLVHNPRTCTDLEPCNRCRIGISNAEDAKEWR